ncbi:MAG: helix-turn-helix transcriptional regulator [Muribaculaceae bacterium]|nr:helix-turn-helix transcriptional regulator [Muribaculaceae bacterium]
MDDKADLPYGLVGEGATVAEAMAEWNQAYNDMRKLFEEEGKEFVEADFSFAYDVPSFLLYYAGKLTYAGLSKLTGISAAQLSQYANGYRNPSPKTTAKIQSALHAFGQELSQLQLV